MFFSTRLSLMPAGRQVLRFDLKTLLISGNAGFVAMGRPDKQYIRTLHQSHSS
jgi:hypothetical protein